MAEIQSYPNPALSTEQIEKLFDLLYLTWPQPQLSKEELIAGWFGGVSKGESYRNGIRHVIWGKHKAIAHAMEFQRKIYTEKGPLTVLALAGVCTLPEKQGLGLGKTIVRKAFETVDRGALPVALFQTDVPRFYEKLQCRIIDNPFHNRQNNSGPDISPWWAEYVMIYPAIYDWPEGRIDLNGGGY